jgi:Passenger-associated-transport-repeat
MANIRFAACLTAENPKSSHPMKNKQSRLFFIAGLALLVADARAADFTWDNSTAAGIQVPATGTWTLGGGGWTTGGTVAQNWAIANVAVFGGADGTYGVTVGGSFSAQKISFINSGYTLSGTTSRVITLTATAGTTNLPQLAVIGGKSATIGSNVTVNAQQTFYIGAADGNAGGTLNIEGGTVGTSTNAGSSVVIDGNGTVVNVKTGGTLRLLNTGNSNSNAAIVVGQLAGSIASLNVDGGSVLVNQGNSGGTGGFLVGNIGQGTVTLTNGTIEVLSTAPLGVTFGNNLASAGANTLHLDGGILTTSIIRKGAGTATATFNFNGGLLKANANSASFMTGLTTANVKNGGARFDTNGFNITVGQALVDDGTGGLSKEGGSGTLTLTGVNTYDGNTTISAGTLALSGSGSISNSSKINISTTLSVTGLTSDFTVGSAQTVGGSGTILATGKAVVANGTLAPGNSPGTLTQDGGSLQLGVGGDYNWQIHDATGAAGTGYDTTNLINGATLDLSLLSAGNTYNINLWSLSSLGPDVNGDAINFNNTLNYSWTLFSTGTAITGFSTDKFTINTGVFNATSGYSNALGGGTFSVALADGNTDLVLNFTAVPEPGAALLGGLGFLALLRRRR